MCATYPNEKFCIECVHHKTGDSTYTQFGEHRCHAPKNGLNVVTKQPITPSCAFARSLSGKCGPTATLYNPISEPERISNE